MQQQPDIQPAITWFSSQNWTPQDFQLEAWNAYLKGYSGIVNAPTGSGKTYSLGIAVLLEGLKQKKSSKTITKGLQVIWITPIRALAVEIRDSLSEASAALRLGWKVEIRTGDTTVTQRTRQKRNMPEVLITTPESLHLLLATKEYPALFRNLRCLVADEWHDLMGTKRAVQLELALSRLRTINPGLKVWGISATIGNMDEATEVLLTPHPEVHPKRTIIRSGIRKKIEIRSILPDEVEHYPWAGHLGVKLLEKVVPIIHASRTTLIFTNTRSQAESWYQRLLAEEPSLAGVLAMHHSSISKQTRQWVEESLHEEKLKAVVCTSSLDLGVDFHPVETIIQVGGPKGIARFAQRAGRSGHRPGATSLIWFLPTHSLELLEAAALRQAIREEKMESRTPYLLSFDVLIQYLITLAVSDGFYPEEIFREVKSTFCFQELSRDEWNWVLRFITHGGESLATYQEFHKVAILPDGLHKVQSRRTAMLHRLSIGTIVSDPVLLIKLVSGKYIGSIEEWFISRLKPGDVFWFAGNNLELIRIKEMTVQVKINNSRKGIIPSWQGGRLPLSSRLAAMLRRKLTEAMEGNPENDEELEKIRPILVRQQEESIVPREDEFLIEYTESREGHHLFMYPFEGRFVHEGLSSIIAYRISLLQPISFSLGFNDYGFELLSDQPIPIEEALENNILSPMHLFDDIRASINAVEMARRRFRDIAGVSGLTFKGFPGKYQKDRHLQASAQLFFDVFLEHEPDNLLLREAFTEVMELQLEEQRLRETLNRINGQKIILKRTSRFSPFSFPLVAERFREKLSSEQLEERLKKMTLNIEKEISRQAGKKK